MASDPWNGLPENPERDGWHWLRSRIGGNVRVDQWLKEGLWMHCSINSTVRLSYEYLGPCLTPADLAARVEAERVRVTEHACAVIDANDEYDQRLCCDGRECGCQGATVHQQMQHYIRALGPTPAYDAAIKAAREDGMGAALLAVSQLTQPENGETGDLRFMRDAWNGVVEEAKAAIRAAKDQPA